MTKTRKANVVIRMGASRWYAVVRVGDAFTVFDLHKMSDKGVHEFRRELTKAFREAGIQHNSSSAALAA